MSIVKFQGGDAVTMTSLELVDFINNYRKEQADLAGFEFPCEAHPELTHANLLAKIPKVLAERSHSFECDLPDSYGRSRRGYRFPKRETCLMAMSYSYELQAAVFDHMTELEQTLAQQNAFVLPRTRAEALRLAADLEEQNEVLALENQQQAKKIESLEHFFMPGETPAQFAKRLNGVNSLQISAHLLGLGWIWNSERRAKKKPKYRTTYLAREKDLLTERPRKIDGEDLESPIIRYELQLLEEGSKVLHDLYMAEKLPMKKTWDGQFFYDKFTPEKPL